MNIFFLAQNAGDAARLHADIHVVKMASEVLQMICNALRYAWIPYIWPFPLYKKTHTNHPCTKWIRFSTEHYQWAMAYGIALCKEYGMRYSVASGLKWQKATGLTTGHTMKLVNEKLLNALVGGNLDFTETEWDQFGVVNLTMNHIVITDDACFQPAQTKTHLCEEYYRMLSLLPLPYFPQQDYAQLFDRNKISTFNIPANLSFIPVAMADLELERHAVYSMNNQLDGIETYKTYYMAKRLKIQRSMKWWRKSDCPEELAEYDWKNHCFCGTNRHEKDNDHNLPFNGAWICCDVCEKWIHGDCAGLTLKVAEATDVYECRNCQTAKRQKCTYDWIPEDYVPTVSCNLILTINKRRVRANLFASEDGIPVD